MFSFAKYLPVALKIQRIAQSGAPSGLLENCQSKFLEGLSKLIMNGLFKLIMQTKFSVSFSLIFVQCLL